MSVGAVVLAAGKGTRFKSDRAKVLHEACGRSLLRWVLEALRPLGLERVVVVVGHQADEVAAEAAAAELTALTTVTQHEQRGTGHAVRTAFDAGALEGCDTVLVANGDAPLLTAEPLWALLEAHAGSGRAATLLTAHLDDPAGYGRVVRGPDGALARIVEEGDADEATRALAEVNAGVYAFAADALAKQLAGLSADTAAGEEYLTDVVEPLVPAGVGAVAGDPEVLRGVNDRAQLADAAAALRARLLESLMRDGVTVTDPRATYVDAEVAVAADATLHPGTILEGGTRVGAGAVVGPHSHLSDTVVGEGAEVHSSRCDGAEIGPRASVGPHSFLRPGARLAAEAKVGAFCEVKSSDIGEGAKVPHLSYVGDATIGAGANIGAATVTVNYDGFEKHRTEVGARARVGSDTMLVAPVRVGEDAFTGAGSVITEDVPDGALAVERAEQVTKPGYAERKRARVARKRAAEEGREEGREREEGSP